MAIALWVVIGLLSGVLFLITISGFDLSVVLLFTGQELQRCPHCNRYGIARPGQLHVPSCPPNRFLGHDQFRHERNTTLQPRHH